MPETQRTIRVTTRQHVLEDVPAIEEGFPMRKWSISVCMLNQNGEEIPATVFDKVTYKLHPTFVNPTRTVKKPPFTIEEQGWGEFDLGISFHIIDRGGEHSISHDLNFRSEEYKVDHVIMFPTNKPQLARVLAESGPVPGLNSAGEKRKVDDANGSSATSAASAAPAQKKKKSRTFEKASIDLERLAEGLKQLGEDDLLGVVQMVTDNKTPEMFIKNDVEQGEFHMDLSTLPDPLLKSLWDYVKKRVEV